MNNKNQLPVFIIAALVVSSLPYVSWPFNWIETYFHEISHGFAAVLTGGRIEEIVIRLDGSGYCTYRGGWQSVTGFAGYTGAILAGALLYVAARSLGKSSAVISIALAVLIGYTIVAYARDVVTILILLSLIVLFYFSWSDRFGRIFNRTEEFIGIYVLLNGMRSPFHLLDGKQVGDGADLARITFIPELVWVGIWVVIGVVALIGLWRFESRARLRSW